MEVINPMGDEKFEVVCEAGVKLVNELKKVLAMSGLGPEQAASVLAMATGGVIKSTEIDPEQFLQAAYVAFQMWRQDEEIEGIDGAIFDPPHKRQGFVPVKRDSSKEN